VTTDARLNEGAPAVLGGERFGVANVWERTYATDDGTEVTGSSAQLLFESGRQEIAGAGTRVRFGEEDWLVVEVHSGTPGAIVVRPLGV
jgi:hypothetical protein